MSNLVKIACAELNKSVELRKEHNEIHLLYGSTSVNGKVYYSHIFPVIQTQHGNYATLLTGSKVSNS